MSKLNVMLPAAIVGLIFAGSAAAASLQPASGQAPFFNPAVATSSSASRADIAAQAAAQTPAAGETSAIANVTDMGSTLTRAQVRQETAETAAELGHFPAASGVNS